MEKSPNIKTTSNRGMVIFDALPQQSRDRINYAMFPVTMDFLIAEWTMRGKPKIVPFIDKYVEDLERIIMREFEV
jgi:hypothetical protein